MPLLTHLTGAKNAEKIKRSGIRIERHRGRAAIGVYCMPLLPNFYTSHQWVRELRRRGDRQIVACDFRLASSEPVLVGHYNSEKVTTNVGEAIGIIMHAEDPRGYEIIVPRKISVDELHKTRQVPHVIGWRYYPESHGRRPCPCPVCGMAGGIKDGKRRRELLAESGDLKPTRSQIKSWLQNAKDQDELIAAIDSLSFYTWKDSSFLTPLLFSTNTDQLAGLALALLHCRDDLSITWLQELARSHLPDVREIAAFALLTRLGEQAIPFLETSEFPEVLAEIETFLNARA